MVERVTKAKDGDSMTARMKHKTKVNVFCTTNPKAWEVAILTSSVSLGIVQSATQGKYKMIAAQGKNKMIAAQGKYKMIATQDEYKCTYLLNFDIKPPAPTVSFSFPSPCPSSLIPMPISYHSIGLSCTP